MKLQGNCAIIFVLCRSSSVVEQCFRKAEVAGSNPAFGSDIMSQIDAFNPQLLTEIDELFEQLKSGQVVVTDTTATSKHYTFIVRVPHIESRLEEITKTLISLDSTLIVNKPGLAHVTVFHFPDIEKLSEATQIIREESANDEKIKLQIYGLFTGPLAIGLAVFPLTKTLVQIRKKLYEISGQDFPNNYRGLLAWITVARFTRPPTMELIKYLDTLRHEDFGTITVNEIEVYQSQDKNLETGELLDKIVLSK